MTVESKRKEPFRYMLTTPTECTFEIIQINGYPISAKPAEAAIIDLSKSGCKLYTKLDLNAENNRIKLLVNLAIDGQAMKYRGTIRWQKQTEHSFHYGIQLELIDSEIDQMLADIKALATHNKIEVV
ncbi:MULTISPECIES: PilZ domain-containing protein [unclassified Paenibacillus]|uniref:PilZ domain-containing protein n=1 Tax=unclassified Paenibacillus TaxID=185978 RepID=UPI0036381EC2